MQNYINKIQTNLDKLSSLKKQRALDAMPEKFQRVFQLLPVLLHYNHPNLPGYHKDNVINGIARYVPTLDILSLLVDVFAIDSNELVAELNPSISALYSMGSTCSIGQSIDSDLDIWVCVEQNFTDEQRDYLQLKCQYIEQWADAQNIQLTLFIVDVDRFRDKHHECLMGENCGSAQHMLLLEEFYRTANLLAGKFLLWYVIPTNLTINNIQYASYEQCVQVLITSGSIRRDEWIDFGSLQDLSAEEYFGASLWQLYKSVDSPFKAVLKTLLLETYSWEYPVTKPIAYQIKSFLQSDEIYFAYLDPYYLLLEKITHYLITNNDPQRLLLIRGCFYLKVNEQLSQTSPSHSWRRELLSELVKSWGWNEDYINYLDQYQHWKIGQVRYIHEVLLQAMMTGYRNLLNFGRRNNLDALISPQDLAILTRKLYAAYEVLPGKITMLNFNITNDLAEDDITFINVKNDRVNRAGWYVYNQKPTLNSIVGHQYLEYSPSLLKLVSWCYFNGLISDNTQLFYREGSNHNPSKVQQLVRDLSSYFLIKAPAVTEEALYGPCEIRHLAIMINLEHDPTEQLNLEAIAAKSLNYDVLNYGKDEVSLVQSVDLLYRNSWNEIRVLHFSGSLSVPEALKTLLNRMHKDADLPDSIEIFCYSKHLQSEIKQQIKLLIDRSIDLRLQATKSNLRQFKPLRIDGSSWYLFFERLGVSLHQFDNTIDFYGAVSNNKVQGQALNILDDANELPKEIDSVASEGIIQFFFEDTKTGFDLYILNEHNQIEIYRNCNGNKQNMIRDVNSFYAISDDRFTFATSSSVNFNLPQFYQILYNNDGQREVMPFN